MKNTIAAALLLAASLPFPAVAQWQTTCTQLAYSTLCSSGGTRGFNGSQYQLGYSTITEGYNNGRRVRCESYQLGYSTQTRCN